MLDKKNRATTKETETCSTLKSCELNKKKTVFRMTTTTINKINTHLWITFCKVIETQTDIILWYKRFGK